MYKLDYIKDNTTFDELYVNGTTTLEGVVVTDTGLKQIEMIIRECGFKEGMVNFLVATGNQVNEYYGLTGVNAYPDDFNILFILDFYSLKFNHYGNKIFPVNYNVVGWWNEIVDKNLIREVELNEQTSN